MGREPHSIGGGGGMNSKRLGWGDPEHPVDAIRGQKVAQLRATQHRHQIMQLIADTIQVLPGHLSEDQAHFLGKWAVRLARGPIPFFRAANVLKLVVMTCPCGRAAVVRVGLHGYCSKHRDRARDVAAGYAGMLARRAEASGREFARVQAIRDGQRAWHRRATARRKRPK